MERLSLHWSKASLWGSLNLGIWSLGAKDFLLEVSLPFTRPYQSLVSSLNAWKLVLSSVCNTKSGAVSGCLGSLHCHPEWNKTPVYSCTTYIWCPAQKMKSDCDYYYEIAIHSLQFVVIHWMSSASFAAWVGLSVFLCRIILQLLFVDLFVH